MQSNLENYLMLRRKNFALIKFYLRSFNMSERRRNILLDLYLVSLRQEKSSEENVRRDLDELIWKGISDS